MRTDITIWKCDICGTKSFHKYRSFPKWFWAHSNKLGIVSVCDKCANKIEENEIDVKLTPLGQ